jgi:DNA polymerase-1
VLALGYGAGPGKLRETLALDGFFLPLHEVEDTFDKLQRVYRVLFSWKEDVIRDAKLVGYVDTLSGHRRRIHFGQATSWRELKAGREGRQAANAKVQGSAADIVARTMVNLDNEFSPRVRLLVQVHDELVMEARHGVVTPEDLARIEHIATQGHGFDLSVPLEFKPRIVRSWAEGKD